MFLCLYCMPAEGIDKNGHDDILSNEELLQIAQARRLDAMYIDKLDGTSG
jgi:hypothetical protein